MFPLEVLPSLPTKAVVGYWVGGCHRKLDMNPNVIAAAITKMAKNCLCTPRIPVATILELCIL